MSKDSNQAATSTPKADSSDEKVLRENFFDFSEIKPEGVKRTQKNFKTRATKENSKRSNPRPSSNERQLEKRRLQAVEAMKIAEQRRHRLAQGEPTDDSLTDSMANLSISSVEYLPDGRIKLSRKELLARQAKHRRIREFMAEQKARKRQERKAKMMRRPSYKIKTHSWTPRPVFHRRLHYLGIARQAFKLDMPKFNGCCDEEYESEYQDFEEDEYDGPGTPPTIVNGCIRYSIERLRELNPYGYFFM